MRATAAQVSQFQLMQEEGDNMSSRLADALFAAAMYPDELLQQIIIRRFGYGESHVKTCRELYISNHLYYQKLRKFKTLVQEEYADNEDD